MSEITGSINLDTEPKSNYEQKRWHFFVNLGLRYRELLSSHRRGGQLSRDVVRNGKRERWGDPTEHCLVETAGAEILSDLIGLSAEDKANFTTAAFVHDAYKRREIELTRGVTDPAAVENIMNESKDLLLEDGVDPAAVELVDAVSHTSLDQFVDMDAEGGLHLKENLSAAKMAMHYLDDVTNRTQIGSFDARMDALEEKARAGIYAFNEEGRAVWGGRTFYEAQRQVGHMIENRLAQMAHIDDPKNLPDAIAHILDEKINSTELPK